MTHDADLNTNDIVKSGEDASAQVTGGFRHAVATTTSGSFAVQLQAGELQWALDEPVSMGGNGAAPDPVTAFLGALCGCLLISLQITARARQVPIVGATMSARANEKGFVKTLAVDLTVYSDAPEEKLRTVVERAEKGCYIKGLLKESIEYRLDLTIQPAGDWQA
ncbi:MAG: OsmC family protein [Candidatus Binatia bacterium]